MRSILAGAMMIIMALCVLWATVAYGAVTPELAAPVYGMAILLAPLWAAKLFFARVVSWKHSPMHWPVLGFAVYAVIRYFTAPVEYEARLELFQVGLCTLVYFLTSCNFYRQRDRTLLLAVLMVPKGTVQTSALQKVLIAYIALMTLVGIVITLSPAGWLATLVGLLV